MATNDCRELPPLTARKTERYWVYAGKLGPKECWLWTGYTNGRYGQLTITTGKGRRQNVGAHRIAYLLGYGVDPGSMHVLHKCDQPLCQNPAHLFLGSQTDNMHDCQAKGRKVNGGFCRKGENAGERHGMSKLKESEVVEIRALHVTGLSHGLIAKQFGISRSLIGLIVNRQRWQHVP